MLVVIQAGVFAQQVAQGGNQREDPSFDMNRGPWSSCRI
jgi:hypothetical protein